MVIVAMHTHEAGTLCSSCWCYTCLMDWMNGFCVYIDRAWAQVPSITRRVSGVLGGEMELSSIAERIIRVRHVLRGQ